MKFAQGIAAGITGLLCATGVAWPQPYPNKPVRVIVPFPPGGANDIIARVVLPKLSEQMGGKTFLIDNRSGAGGTIGTNVVAQSPPDGYTLLVQSAASHVSNAHLYKKLPYDPIRDFVGVSPLGRLVTVLTVHPSMPLHTVKDFLTLAKKQPKAILFGHAGQGSFIHLNTVYLENKAGISVTQVPFKGGGPATVGLISGETQGMLAGIGDIIEHIKAKRARPLGVSTDERVKMLPGVPTIAETIPGYEISTWVSLFAPAGTPKAIVDQLNAELGKVLRDPGVMSRLTGIAYDAIYRSPEELDKRVKADHETIGNLFSKAGVQAN